MQIKSHWAETAFRVIWYEQKLGLDPDRLPNLVTVQHTFGNEDSDDLLILIKTPSKLQNNMLRCTSKYFFMIFNVFQILVYEYILPTSYCIYYQSYSIYTCLGIFQTDQCIVLSIKFFFLNIVNPMNQLTVLADEIPRVSVLWESLVDFLSPSELSKCFNLYLVMKSLTEPQNSFWHTNLLNTSFEPL